MKNLIFFTFIAIFFMTSCGSSGQNTSEEIDFTKPESVVQAVFDAAQSGNFEILKNLCDPIGENDGDTKRICTCADDEKNRAELIEYFKTGKVAGAAKINGEEAEVDFTFGPNGNDKETMKLINRDGKWYLYSF